MCNTVGLVEHEIERTVQKVPVSKDNTITENPRDQEKVRGIDDFELKEFELIKSN